MSAPVREWIHYLDGLMEPSRFKDGQPNGLHVEGEGPIARLATSVSVNAEVLDAAVAWNADALLSHHGLLWSYDALPLTGIRRARLAKVFASGLHLMAYHLPLDAHPSLGNNAALADAARCVNVEPAFPYGGADIGCVGELNAPESFDDFTARFERSIRTGCDVATGPVQIWAHGPERVERIAFVSGAGAGSAEEAANLGADVLVTGEVREPAYHVCKEAGIHLVAAGHYLTERLGVQRLGAAAAKHFGAEHRFFDVATEA